jgi:hypothetical protein
MDNFYLKECYESYITTFPEGWLDSLDDQSGEELFKPWFEKINKFSEKGFILFSKFLGNISLVMNLKML